MASENDYGSVFCTEPFFLLFGASRGQLRSPSLIRHPDEGQDLLQILAFARKSIVSGDFAFEPK